MSAVMLLVETDREYHIQNTDAQQPSNNGMDRSRAVQFLNLYECCVRGPVIPALDACMPAC
jgi:hypothetical protein